MSDLRSEAKVITKALLPKSWADFISGCRYRGSLAHFAYVRKLRKYQLEYARANASAPKSMVILPSAGSVRIPPDARDAFEHFGWRDPEMVDELIGFMELASGRKTLWDVGALFGIFSLAFTLADPTRRALAFEPNPVSRTKLKECLKLNPTAKVQAFDFALGLRGQVVEFERGFHYTAVAGLPVRPDGKDLVEQETVSVDELIERNFDPPDILKIDVEGHEFEVLQGAKALLFSSKPSLSIELHPGLLTRKGTSAVVIARYLEQAGYVFHDTHLRRVDLDFFGRRDNFRVFAA